MRTRSAFVIAISTVVVFQCNGVFTWTAAIGEVPEWLKLISSGDENNRNKARLAFEQHLESLGHYLVQIVEEPIAQGEQFYGSTRRNDAMRLIGKLRYIPAVPSLIKHLEPTEGQGTFRTELSPFSPAGQALVDIGMPGRDLLLEALCNSEEQNEPWRQMLVILVELSGGLEEACIYLGREAEAKREREEFRDRIPGFVRALRSGDYYPKIIRSK